MKLLIPVLVLILSTSVAFANCVAGVQSVGNLQIQTLSFSDDAGPECAVMLSPASSVSSYRVYTISQRGVVQIFNNYDLTSNNSEGTGARSFFFFPRKAIPAVASISGSLVQITTSSGVKLSFNPGTPPAANGTGWILPGFTSRLSDPILVTESPSIVPTNDGGVEFKQTPQSGTLILDTGFQMGDAAFADSTGSSTFIDPQNDQCVVKNTEVFTYGSSGDPDVTYATDAELWAYLAKRCPNLKLPSP